MTKYFQNPDDHSERVDDVLKRAGALSDELHRTITELTQILRAEDKGGANARQSTK